MSGELYCRCLATEELYSSHYGDFVYAIWGPDKFDKKILYWKWLYCENPNWDHETDIPVFCCFSEERIVGQLGVIPISIKIDNNIIKSGWCIDFYVLDDFQRRGIGRKLLKAAYKNFPILMTLGQTDASRSLFLKENWYVSGALIKHRKILKYYQVLTKFVLDRILPINKKKYSTEMRAWYSSDETRSLCYHIEIKDTVHTPKVIHDDIFLSWRYQHNPIVKYRFNKYIINQNECIILIWRMKRNNRLIVADIIEIIHRSNTSQADLNNILMQFTDSVKKEGADLLECQTSNSAITNALSTGVYYNKKSAIFLYGSNDMRRCTFYPVEEWDLVTGDCDIDMWSETF